MSRPYIFQLYRCLDPERAFWLCSNTLFLTFSSPKHCKVLHTLLASALVQDRHSYAIGTLVLGAMTSPKLRWAIDGDQLQGSWDAWKTLICLGTNPKRCLAGFDKKTWCKGEHAFVGKLSDAITALADATVAVPSQQLDDKLWPLTELLLCDKHRKGDFNIAKNGLYRLGIYSRWHALLWCVKQRHHEPSIVPTPSTIPPIASFSGAQLNLNDLSVSVSAGRGNLWRRPVFRSQKMQQPGADGQASMDFTFSFRIPSRRTSSAKPIEARPRSVFGSWEAQQPDAVDLPSCQFTFSMPFRGNTAADLDWRAASSDQKSLVGVKPRPMRSLDRRPEEFGVKRQCISRLGAHEEGAEWLSSSVDDTPARAANYSDGSSLKPVPGRAPTSSQKALHPPDLKREGHLNCDHAAAETIQPTHKAAARTSAATALSCSPDIPSSLSGVQGEAVGQSHDWKRHDSPSQSSTENQEWSLVLYRSSQPALFDDQQLSVVPYSPREAQKRSAEPVRDTSDHDTARAFLPTTSTVEALLSADRGLSDRLKGGAETISDDSQASDCNAKEGGHPSETESVTQARQETKDPKAATNLGQENTTFIPDTSVINKGFKDLLLHADCSPPAVERRREVVFCLPQDRYDKVLRKILQKMETPPTQETMAAGAVYIYFDPKSPGELKIGKSHPGRGAGIRVSQQGKKCEIDAKLLVHFEMPCAPQYMERFVQLELEEYQVDLLKCPCGTRHREWFRCKLELAMAVVLKWQAFSASMPYKANGGLKDIWLGEIQAAKDEAEQVRQGIIHSRENAVERWHKRMKDSSG
jgi:hypothetical protein